MLMSKTHALYTSSMSSPKECVACNNYHHVKHYVWGAMEVQMMSFMETQTRKILYDWLTYELVAPQGGQKVIHKQWYNDSAV